MLRGVALRTRAVTQLCAACRGRRELANGAPSGGAASLASQLVAFAQSRVAAGAHDEAAQVLEHGLTMVGPASSGGDAHAAVQSALAAVAADRRHLAHAASLFSAAAHAAAASSPELAVAARCSAASAHTAAGDADAALALVRSKDADALAAAVGDAATLALAGAAGAALHAAGRISAAGEAYAALSAAPTAGGATNDGVASAPHGASLAAALHGAAAWHACTGSVASARTLFEATASLAHACAATATASPAAPAPPSAPQLLSAAAAVEVSADAALGLAQLALRAADVAAAERHCDDALRLAESVSGPGHARVGVVLAVSADVTMARLAAAAVRAAGGVLSDSDGVYVAEALYRKALQLLSATGGGAGGAALSALLQRRLAEVLRVSGPNRAPEAERLIASAAAALDGESPGLAAVGKHAARPWAKAADGEPMVVLSLRLLHALPAAERAL
jgi:hypothetical protein